jgi:peptidoglycan hydrolase-like protein with peptidoglycan-binding domain
LRATSVASHHETIGISNERATEIQTALIQHGYLTGEPSGTWDAETAAAMAKLQADNGWGTKVTPDARALIKLGLGPQQPATTPQAPPQS